MSEFQLTQSHRMRSALQHFYPKRLLSALMFRATRVRYAPFKNWQIRWFIRKYQVDMNQALEGDPQAYPEFNTFFTRPLRADARPLKDDPYSVSSPADGTVLERGNITDRTLLQVKGLELDVAELLGHDDELTRTFANGRFATVYLSPRDYHRVHMPADGTLTRMGYVPGQLFSVSLPCVYSIPRLFSRNERVISVFDTAFGPMAVILVGAVFVGCIETLWEGPVIGDSRKQTTWWDYRDADTPIFLARGDEMGRFNMGSTVITLFADDRARWAEKVRPGQPISMGQDLADFDAS